VNDARSVVLVEGYSDQRALEALAPRLGLDLAAERVAVVPIGGAHAVRASVGRFPHERLAALCDAGEREVFVRGGIAEEALFVCVADLEDELIRAHGAAGVETLLAEHGDLTTFRTFQRQPAWRGRPIDAQLHRFLGSSGGRHLRYPPILVAALDPERAPAPLAGVLRYAASPGVTIPAS